MVLRKHTLYNIWYLSFEWICIYTNILWYELIKKNILLKQECLPCVQVINCGQFSDGTFFFYLNLVSMYWEFCYGEPLGLICLTAVAGYLYQIYLNQIKEFFIILILNNTHRMKKTYDCIKCKKQQLIFYLCCFSYIYFFILYLLINKSKRGKNQLFIALTSHYRKTTKFS